MTQGTVQCTSCENNYPIGRFTECPSCDEPLTQAQANQPVPRQNQAIQGNGNNAIQNDGDGNTFIVNNAAEEEQRTTIHRTNIKPYRLGKQVNLKWTMTIGAINFLGSLASMLSFWNHPILFAPVFGIFPWIYVPFLLGMIIFLWSLLLNDAKSKHIWFGSSFEDEGLAAGLLKFLRFCLINLYLLPPIVWIIIPFLAPF